jgi:hypothetical protein
MLSIPLRKHAQLTIFAKLHEHGARTGDLISIATGPLPIVEMSHGGSAK